MRPSTASLVLLALCVPPAGCTDSGASAPPVPTPAPQPSTLPFSPTTAVLRRLTQAQYTNTVQDVLGADIVVTGQQEPDVTISGFAAVGASDTSISPLGVEAYETIAYNIAQQAMASTTDRAALVTCTPVGTVDRVCAQSFVTSVGQALWRRPLAADEVARLTLVAMQSATTLNNFYTGLQFALAVMLQSPDFLFRAELSEPDPANPGQYRYDAYSFASRLAYYFWNGPPDAALLTAAQAGALDTPAGVSTQVSRLLADPRAHRGLREFVTEWLSLSQLDGIEKDTTVFTEASSDMGASAREETLRDFEHSAFDLRGDFRDLLTTQTTYVNAKLAELYDIPAPVGDAMGFGIVTLPANAPRRGILGQVSVLALQSHPTTTSPTLRGKFVREALLCDTIPPPPVNVNTALPTPGPGLVTLRQRLIEHSQVSFCAGCHTLMDPVGLALENFDGIGRFRTTDSGEPIDPSGHLDAMTFQDFPGLTQVLHDAPQLAPCFATQMYTFAVGHVPTAGESLEVSNLAASLTANGYQILSLMSTIATDPAFRSAAATGSP